MEGHWPTTRGLELTSQGQMVAFADALGPDPALADVDDAALERSVTTMAAELAAAECAWLARLAELVVRKVWARQGCRTPGQWLSWRIGMAPATAREKVRVALQLRELPQLRARFAAGTLSYSKVRALTRVATPDLEPLLLAWADAAPAAHLEELVASWRRWRSNAAVANDPDGPPERPQVEVRHRRGVLDTSVAVDLTEDDAFALLSQLDVLAAQLQADRGDGVERLPHSEARAEALLAAVTAAVTAKVPIDTSGADRHTVVVHVRADDLAETETDGSPDGQVQVHRATVPQPDATRAASAHSDGGGPNADAQPDTGAPHAPRPGCAPVPMGEPPLRARAPSPREAERPAAADPTPTRLPQRAGAGSGLAVVAGPATPRPVGLLGTQTRTSLRRLREWLCEAAIITVVSDADGDPTAVSRRQRRLNAAQRRALIARDAHCRFPGCHARRHLHAHHIRHLADGGPTELWNLVLLCGHHHRVVHRDGWTVGHDGHGRFAFTPPGARSPALPGPPLPGASAEAAHHRLEAAGTLAHERSLYPAGWDGQGYDVSFAIEIIERELARTRPPARFRVAA